MVKIKVVSRKKEDFGRNSQHETEKEMYNPSSQLHGFAKPREYVRALNASKYEKWFSRPFLGAVNGHEDTPQILCVHPLDLNIIISGSCEGEIILWNMMNRESIWKDRGAHGNRFTTGLVFDRKTGRSFLSCGKDQKLNSYKIEGDHGFDKISEDQSYNLKKGTFECMDIHFDNELLCTGGEEILIWDRARFIPKQKYSPSYENIISCRFHKVEKDILGVTTEDNRVCLFDLRVNTIIKKFEMLRRGNQICFNPMRPFHFSIGSDDSNAYTFDLRKITKGPLLMHSGHIGPVTSLDYSPIGDEFSTGSYDKTVRIFRVDDTYFHSREVYHGQRMHRVWSVKFSLDGKFIFSGSDDHSIRIWKTKADEPLRVLSKSEKQQLNYQKSLMNRYKDFKEIRRIKDYRHVPKKIRNETKRMKEMMGKVKRKEEKTLTKKKKLMGNQWSRDIKRTFRGEKEEELIGEAFDDDEEDEDDESLFE